MPATRHRFSVRIAGKEHVRGKNTTQLVFVEVVAPTIIRSPDGGDMRSIVSALIEPDNGRLWRADVITRDPSQGAFPSMHVIRWSSRNDRPWGCSCRRRCTRNFLPAPIAAAWGDATYTNYRRFQTSARIVPQ